MASRPLSDFKQRCSKGKPSHASISLRGAEVPRGAHAIGARHLRFSRLRWRRGFRWCQHDPDIDLGLKALFKRPESSRAAVSVAPHGRNRARRFTGLSGQLEARRNGYALIRNRVSLGTSAVGRHVRNSLGHPVAAVSFAAINARMDARQVRVVAEKVVAAAMEMEAAMRLHGPARTGQ